MFIYLFLASPRVDTIPTEEEQATGLERREFEAMVAGNMVGFVFLFTKS